MGLFPFLNGAQKLQRRFDRDISADYCDKNDNAATGCYRKVVPPYRISPLTNWQRDLATVIDALLLAHASIAVR